MAVGVDVSRRAQTHQNLSSQSVLGRMTSNTTSMPWSFSLRRVYPRRNVRPRRSHERITRSAYRQNTIFLREKAGSDRPLARG